jgi:mono/diheme cytochrome c family protein
MLPCPPPRAWILAVVMAAICPPHSLFAEPQGADNTPAAAPPAVDERQGEEFFEKEVRPLLAARCHECHGALKQKGNLRLDSRATALKGGDTAPAVIPGKPEESLLVDAIRYGETYQMPPKSQLPPDEIATLVRWVRIGAPWGRETQVLPEAKPSSDFDLAERARHWSWQPIVAVEPPAVIDAGWAKTAIDRFILARLEAAGIAPAPLADKRTLLRRVTFDLIGLPPTVAEIDNFLADDSPLAFEKVVDRLLASPHYGERWARHWLDLVRFAETQGHEFDFDIPNAYRYRDYVIRALNADVPYDQFVVEHVAGDLLANPRRHPQEGFNESIIGTGFFFLGEAKHSPVDVRQDEADRVDNQIDVFAKTFLGLTVSCARCHDHKFDAISTEDYYALAGYLQSSRYQQAYIDPPQPLADVLAGLSRVGDERRAIVLAHLREQCPPRLTGLASALLTESESPSAGDWSEQMRKAASNVEDPFHPWAVLSAKADSGGAQNFAERRAALVVGLKEKLASAPEKSAKIPANGSLPLADFGVASYAPWQATGAAFGQKPLAAGDLLPLAPYDRASAQLAAATSAHSGLISARLQGTLRSPTFEIVSPRIAYRLHGTGGHVRLIVDGLQLIRDPIYGGLQFKPKGPESHWHEQDVSKWVGHRAYIEVIDDGDGFIALEKVLFLDGPLPPARPNPLVVAALDEPGIVSLELLAQKYQSICQQVISQWLADGGTVRSDGAERAAIARSILDSPLLGLRATLAESAAVRSRLQTLDERQAALESRLEPPRQAMAMADGTAEDEVVFIRGSHKTPGAVVPRRFLEALGGKEHPAPDEGSGRRELAEQMVSSANPLAARVMVNRLWHHHFGAGIVRSPDDFGVMGQRPTHPELLDYLAEQFVREGWSLKAMHRLIVLSNTYRMSSQPQHDADRADPENKLWHRMAVRRLEAESIRDAILAVSGQANPAMYGPSVMPYLTSFMSGRGRPGASGPLDGGGRRSIYLSVRRNFLSPMLLAFDYPTPFTTIGRRGVSNVPAQALSMLNNPFVIEQAHKWAAGVMSGAQQDAVSRVRRMYLTALSREPDAIEERAALAFLADVGTTAEAQERAWTELAHVLFNVKEFIFIP